MQQLLVVLLVVSNLLVVLFGWVELVLFALFFVADILDHTHSMVCLQVLLATVAPAAAVEIVGAPWSTFRVRWVLSMINHVSRELAELCRL